MLRSNESVGREDKFFRWCNIGENQTNSSSK